MKNDTFQPARAAEMLPEMDSLPIVPPAGAGFDDETGWGIRRGTFREGVSDGVQVVELCNGPLTVWVLPTRGMGIWQAKCHGIPVGWSSPVSRPVHPAYVHLNSRHGLGWLDGFNELVCRCGLSFNGPPGLDEQAASPIESEVTLHGRIANTPAHSLSYALSTDGRLQVRGIVDEATLFGPNLQLASTISTTLGSAAFRIRDEITNRSAAPAEFELLYHTNVGRPFLEEGSQLHCPARLVVPRDLRAAEGIESWARYLGPTPGYAEQAYFFEMQADEHGQSLALLTNQSGTLGISVRYNTSQLPCFTQWKCTQPEAAGYVTGLEPGTNYPNFKGYERRRGRVRQLEPGETYTVELELEIHGDAESVRQAVAEIARMQGSQPPRILPIPTAPYCNVD